MSNSLRRGLLISFGQTYGLLALQFGASLVIARLLTPADMGVFSIAAVFIGIGHTMRDLGVVEYVVQEKDLTEARIRSAALLAFLGAWTIGIAAWLSAPRVAAFYGVEDLRSLMRVLALNFFLVPFGSVTMAAMRRRLEFGLIAGIQLSVALTQAVLTIGFAMAGERCFSMAYAAVAGSALSAMLVQWHRPRGFPFLPGWSELRRVASFGAFGGLRSLLSDLETGAPDLVIGRVLHMDAVGMFSRAAGLVGLFNRLVVQAAAYVALPHMSARGRAGGDMKEPYLAGVSLITGLSWPFYALLATYADAIIPVLYGPQWDAAVPLVRMICVGEMLLSPFSLQGPLTVSAGHVRWEATRVLVSLLLRLVPLVILVPSGLQAAVGGYALGSALVVPLSLALLRLLFEIPMMQMASSCRRSLAVLGCCVLVLLGSRLILAGGEMPASLRLLLGVFTFIAAWLFAIRWFRHPLQAELEALFARARTRFA